MINPPRTHRYDDEEPEVRNRVATVTSTSPLEVKLAGTSGIPASRLATYGPTLGDLVLVAQQDNDSVIILQQIISGG